MNNLCQFRIHNLKYDTFPLIAHNPFVDMFDCVMWDTMQSHINLGIFCKKPYDLTIVTWNNGQVKGCFESQLDSLSLPYKCLGSGMNWTTNRLKPITLKKYIQNIKTKYVLCADSFDVLILDNIEGIASRLDKIGAKVLFNATCCIYPEIDKHREIEQALCPEPPFQFFNSGLFIGETEFVKKLLDAMQLNDPLFMNSDQYLYRQIYHDWHPEIQIDWRCEVFQIMYIPEAVWGNKRIEDCVELVPKYKVML